MQARKEFDFFILKLESELELDLRRFSEFIRTPSADSPVCRKPSADSPVCRTPSVRNLVSPSSSEHNLWTRDRPLPVYYCKYPEVIDLSVIGAIYDLGHDADKQRTMPTDQQLDGHKRPTRRCWSMQLLQLAKCSAC